jgi:4-alpha-glucanotransferase
MKVDFYLRFHTKFGQKIALTGNLASLGNNELDKALPLTFLNEEFWHTSIELDPTDTETLHYRYLFTNDLGETKKEAERQRIIDLRQKKDIVVIDTWNDESYYENAFYTAPFTEVFFHDQKKNKTKKSDSYTHLFKVKAPVLSENEVPCIIGSALNMGSWSSENPVLLSRKGDWWVTAIEIPASDFAISYKYGIYNLKKETFIRFEEGDNRVLHNDGSEEKITVVHDGFLRLPNARLERYGRSHSRFQPA